MPYAIRLEFVWRKNEIPKTYWRPEMTMLKQIFKPRQIFLLTFGLLLTIASPRLTFPQSFTASLVGTTKDHTGAMIPRVSVSITNVKTGVKYEAVTDESGSYRFLTLEPGEYRLEAELPGFKRYVREGLILRVNQTAKEDVTLEIGELTQAVEVKGTPPLLETEKADLGSVIDQKLILELPTSGRNVFSFVALSPGVRLNAFFGSRGIFTSDFMINGGRGNTNDVLLDGAPNVIGDFNGIALIPPVDSVQEFKLQTSSYSAEFGRTGGGTVNVATRSGTNRFHGTAYDFFQTDKLNANSWFNNSRTPRIDKSKFNQHLYGFNFGGPIFKNRTFFFVDYEGLRRSDPARLLMRVPTALERRGDFSQTFDTRGNLIQIFNPFTTRRDPVTGRFLRDPFLGNRIPAELFDPVALNVLQFIPLPNRAPEDPSGRNNYFASSSSRTRKDQFDLRIDHHVSEKHKLFGRFSYNKVIPTRNPNFWGNAASPDWLKIVDNMRNLVLDDTHTFSPTLLVNGRYSFVRFRANQIPGSFGFDPAGLGLPSDIARHSVQLMFPRFNIQDLGATSVAGFNNQPRDTHALIAGVTKIKGRHSLKSGFDIRILRFNAFQVFNSSGEFSFGRGFTQGPNPLVASATAGFGVSSFLIGTGSGGMNIVTPLSLQRRYYAAYFQDDFKVRSNFTLNLGLRYEVEIGQTERYDRLNFLDLGVLNPISTPMRQRLGRDLFGGLVFVGGEIGRNQRLTDKNNFGPRFGLAWHFAKKAVLRGGYGIFFLPQYLEGEVGTQGFSSTSTPWIGTVDGVTPLNLLRNPFPQGFNRPPGRSQGLLTEIGNTIFAPIRTERTPYIQDFSLGVQYEIMSNLMLEIDYVGSKGTKLPWSNGAFNFNQLDPRFLSLSNDLLTLVDNPFFGVLPANSVIGSQRRITRMQLLRPYPHFTGVIGNWNHAANSIYHAMQLKVEKRFSHGSQFLASWTVSKLIDYSGAIKGFLDRSGASANPQNFYNLRAERAVSSFDVPQIFKLSYTAELPVGRGREFLANIHPILNALVGGWQVNGITTLQSGVPLIFTAPAQSRISEIGRVNTSGLTARLPGSEQTLDRWFRTEVFSLPPPFTFGNYARIAPDLRQARTYLWDLSVFKNFAIRALGEEARVQFRFELFNAFNQVIFGAPVTSVTSRDFGRVLSAGGPRTVQLALKFYF